MNNQCVIGLTMGDPAGVGPELCLRALHNPAAGCPPVVFGQLEVLKRVSALLSLPLPDRLEVFDPPLRIRPDQPAIVDCVVPGLSALAPGVVAAECGAAAFASIQAAIPEALAGRIDAVVTAPVNKESLRLAGVPHAGHTEIFTAMTCARRTCMMLRSDKLTVSMVTTHIGYGMVPQTLTPERILDVIQLTADALARMNQRPPHVAVCGLNPHAGEHGLFGDEETRLIEPAIREARRQGLDVTGPLPPDTVFVPWNCERFDGIVCMYHDQGHIPFKMLAFDEGVNLTLGLPIIRTSVDHGTAFDIAWKGEARPNSLFKAIDLAAQLARGRKACP